MSSLQKIDLFYEWIRELESTKEVIDRVYDRETDKGYEAKVCLYTDNHQYAILAVDRGDEDNGYLGCVVSCRKPRAGEDWTRGNDLPDGPLNYQTWGEIKDAIIRYELVEYVDSAPGEKNEKL